MNVRIIDTNALGSLSVTATSTTEPTPETVTLAGTNGVFEGTLPLRTSLPGLG